MEFGTDINEETGEVNFGFLTFDSGKKIMLDADEAKEVENRLRLAKAEEELCSQTLTPKTHKKEFFVTGAYVQGVEYGNKNLLVVTCIEEDTFCDGEECSDRVEEEYGL